MSNVVDLQGRPIPLEDDLGRDFISDCARYCESLLSEDEIKSKYHFDDGAWEALVNNAPLRQAVDKERARRIRAGDTAREKAQVLFAEAPSVLGDILHGENVSPRHKIDSANALRQIAANGPEAAAALDRFQITIVLNGDVEHYDKPISIGPNDADRRFDIDTTPQVVLPAIEPKGGDDGQPL